MRLMHRIIIAVTAAHTLYAGFPVIFGAFDLWTPLEPVCLRESSDCHLSIFNEATCSTRTRPNKACVLVQGGPEALSFFRHV